MRVFAVAVDTCPPERVIEKIIQKVKAEAQPDDVVVAFDSHIRGVFPAAQIAECFYPMGRRGGLYMETALVWIKENYPQAELIIVCDINPGVDDQTEVWFPE